MNLVQDQARHHESASYSMPGLQRKAEGQSRNPADNLVVGGHDDFLAEQDALLLIAVVNHRTKRRAVPAQLRDRIADAGAERTQGHCVDGLVEAMLEVGRHRQSLSETGWRNEQEVLPRAQDSLALSLEEGQHPHTVTAARQGAQPRSRSPPAIPARPPAPVRRGTRTSVRAPPGTRPTRPSGRRGSARPRPGAK